MAEVGLEMSVRSVLWRFDSNSCVLGIRFEYYLAKVGNTQALQYLLDQYVDSESVVSGVLHLD